MKIELTTVRLWGVCVQKSVDIIVIRIKELMPKLKKLCISLILLSHFNLIFEFSVKIYDFLLIF